MPGRVDLSDPDFEPTDAQLTELIHRAFAGVRPAHEESLRQLRAQITAERAEVLRSLEAVFQRRARG